MDTRASVTVVRLGHRPGRDDRMTTHVALTARALGADRVVLPENATDAVDTARDVTDRFGGPFSVETTDDLLGTIRAWDGPLVHLTMYGEPVQTLEEDLHEQLQDDPMMVVVGAEKVPFEVYTEATHNVAVTNQPHSEIAALAVLLDRVFAGAELDREWAGARKQVLPKETGKQVIDIDPEDS